MVYIYVLQLEQGKYYVGKTFNPRQRFESHFNSNGSEYTKLYKPINIIELKPDCDDYDEDKITRQYMDKYGIDNVRGGSFSSIKLDDSMLKTLKHMENGTKNKCFTCEKSGHFAKECPNKYIKNDNIPSNRGCKWSNEEEKILLEELDKNYDIKTIAQNHNRTEGAIKSRCKLIVYKMHLNNVPIDEIIKKMKLDREYIIYIINNKQIIDQELNKYELNEQQINEQQQQNEQQQNDQQQNEQQQNDQQQNEQQQNDQQQNDQQQYDQQQNEQQQNEQQQNEQQIIEQEMIKYKLTDKKQLIEQQLKIEHQIYKQQQNKQPAKNQYISKNIDDNCVIC
jgi:hypothetical protein